MTQQDLYNFLKANKGMWLSTKHISNCNNNGNTNEHTVYAQICKKLNKMLKYPGIFENLEFKFEQEKRNNRMFSVKYYRVKN